MEKKHLDEDNDEVSYLEFSDFLENNSKREMKNAQNEITMMGDKFLREIDKKKEIESAKKIELIQYILKKEKDKYDYDELYSYELSDVREIYNGIKANKKSFIKFLFGIED